MFVYTARCAIVCGTFLGLLLAIAGCDNAENGIQYDPTPLTVHVPEEFPALPVPDDNPLTEEGVELGKRLFFDTALSSDGRVSCASCHRPEFAFSDPRRFSIGVNGQVGTRQSMPLFNAAWTSELFWDGRDHSLEEQVNDPVQNPVEMNETWVEIESKLSSDVTYPQLFFGAFGSEEITRDRIMKAISQFERTLVSTESKFDRVQRGEASFTDQEQLGFDLFFTEKADCFHCHGTVLFTDHRFHNNGLDSVPSDSGRANVTGNPFDLGLFRSPSLRNIAFTAPYMHDGRFETLEEVIEHYTSTVRRSPTLDPLMRDGRFIDLSEEEKEALIAFLHTLSDSSFISNPDFRPPPRP